MAKRKGRGSSGKKTGKKWGNALGGYKTQSRASNGKFGHGVVASTGSSGGRSALPTTASGNVYRTKSQRRYDGYQASLARKAEADKKARRKKKALLIGGAVGTAAIVGGGAYYLKKNNISPVNTAKAISTTKLAETKSSATSAIERGRNKMATKISTRSADGVQQRSAPRDGEYNHAAEAQNLADGYVTPMEFATNASRAAAVNSSGENNDMAKKIVGASGATALSAKMLNDANQLNRAVKSIKKESDKYEPQMLAKANDLRGIMDSDERRSLDFDDLDIEVAQGIMHSDKEGHIMTPRDKKEGFLGDGKVNFADGSSVKVKTAQEMKNTPSRRSIANKDVRDVNNETERGDGHFDGGDYMEDYGYGLSVRGHQVQKIGEDKYARTAGQSFIDENGKRRSGQGGVHLGENRSPGAARRADSGGKAIDLNTTSHLTGGVDKVRDASRLNLNQVRPVIDATAGPGALIGPGNPMAMDQVLALGERRRADSRKLNEKIAASMNVVPERSKLDPADEAYIASELRKTLAHDKDAREGPNFKARLADAEGIQLQGIVTGDEDKQNNFLERYEAGEISGPAARRTYNAIMKGTNTQGIRTSVSPGGSGPKPNAITRPDKVRREKSEQKALKQISGQYKGADEKNMALKKRSKSGYRRTVIPAEAIPEEYTGKKINGGRQINRNKRRYHDGDQGQW